MFLNEKEIQQPVYYSRPPSRTKTAVTSALIGALLVLATLNGGQVARSYGLTKATTQTDTAKHFRGTWTSLNKELIPKQLARGRKYDDIQPDSICIIAADNREFKSFEKPRIYWNDTASDVPGRLRDVDYPDASTLHNLFWAFRHGYRYLRLKTLDRPGRFRTWGKVPAVLEALSHKECQFIVFTDPDVYVTDPAYSLETMLRYWGMHDKVTLAITAEVPKYPEHADIGQTAVNTGLFVARNNALAQRIFSELDACPDEVPGCNTYLETYWHEQSAFNRFILPSLNLDEDIVVLPAGEGGGWWDSRQEGCEGKFFTHAWDGKQFVGPRSREILVSEMYDLLSKMYLSLGVQ